MLMQKSSENNIDLNAKDIWGLTAFQCACMDGKLETVEMMLENAETFKINLTVKDSSGFTGFQVAKCHGRTRVVNLIEKKHRGITL